MNAEVLTPDNSKDNQFESKSERMVRHTCYNPRCDSKDVKCEVRMKFEDPKKFKDAVQRYVIVNGYNIRWKRSG